MEEITKESASITKQKKPRTEKQLEAFKKCVANRKANIDKRKSGSSAVTSTAVPTAPAAIVDTTQTLLQIQQLKKQMEEQNRSLEEYKAKLQREYEERLNRPSLPTINEHIVDVDNDDDGGDDSMQVEPVRPKHLQQIHRAPIQRSLPTARVRTGEIGFYDQSASNFNFNGKRDVRGMDPYADEKQGMLEKLYARNTNIYKQKVMDQQQRRMLAHEDSIQILAPHQDVTMGENVQDPALQPPSVDRWNPIENMKALIRGEKTKYIGFNGVRAPTGSRTTASKIHR